MYCQLLLGDADSHGTLESMLANEMRDNLAFCYVIQLNIYINYLSMLVSGSSSNPLGWAYLLQEGCFCDVYFDIRYCPAICFIGFNMKLRSNPEESVIK